MQCSILPKMGCRVSPMETDSTLSVYNPNRAKPAYAATPMHKVQMTWLVTYATKNAAAAASQVSTDWPASEDATNDIMISPGSHHGFSFGSLFGDHKDDRRNVFIEKRF